MVDTLTHGQTPTGGNGEPQFDEMQRQLEAERAAKDAHRTDVIQTGLQDLAPVDHPEVNFDAMQAGLDADPDKIGSKAGKAALQQGIVDAGLNHNPGPQDPPSEPLPPVQPQ